MHVVQVSGHPLDRYISSTQGFSTGTSGFDRHKTIKLDAHRVVGDVHGSTNTNFHVLVTRFIFCVERCDMCEVLKVKKSVEVSERMTMLLVLNIIHVLNNGRGKCGCYPKISFFTMCANLKWTEMLLFLCWSVALPLPGPSVFSLVQSSTELMT